MKTLLLEAYHRNHLNDASKLCAKAVPIPVALRSPSRVVICAGAIGALAGCAWYYYKYQRCVALLRLLELRLLAVTAASHVTPGTEASATNADVALALTLPRSPPQLALGFAVLAPITASRPQPHPQHAQQLQCAASSSPASSSASVHDTSDKADAASAATPYEVIARCPPPSHHGGDFLFHFSEACSEPQQLRPPPSCRRQRHQEPPPQPRQQPQQQAEPQLLPPALQRTQEQSSRPSCQSHQEQKPQGRTAQALSQQQQQGQPEQQQQQEQQQAEPNPQAASPSRPPLPPLMALGYGGRAQYAQQHFASTAPVARHKAVEPAEPGAQPGPQCSSTPTLPLPPPAASDASAPPSFGWQQGPQVPLQYLHHFIHHHGDSGSTSRCSSRRQTADCSLEPQLQSDPLDHMRQPSPLRPQPQPQQQSQQDADSDPAALVMHENSLYVNTEDEEEDYEGEGVAVAGRPHRSSLSCAALGASGAAHCGVAGPGSARTLGKGRRPQSSVRDAAMQLVFELRRNKAFEHSQADPADPAAAAAAVEMPATPPLHQHQQSQQQQQRQQVQMQALPYAAAFAFASVTAAASVAASAASTAAAAATTAAAAATLAANAATSVSASAAASAAAAKSATVASLGLISKAPTGPAAVADPPTPEVFASYITAPATAAAPSLRQLPRRQSLPSGTSWSSPATAPEQQHPFLLHKGYGAEHGLLRVRRGPSIDGVGPSEGGVAATGHPDASPLLPPPPQHPLLWAASLGGLSSRSVAGSWPRRASFSSASDFTPSEQEGEEGGSVLWDGGSSVASTNFWLVSTHHNDGGSVAPSRCQRCQHTSDSEGNGVAASTPLCAFSGSHRATCCSCFASTCALPPPPAEPQAQPGCPCGGACCRRPADDASGTNSKTDEAPALPKDAGPIPPVTPPLSSIGAWSPGAGTSLPPILLYPLSAGEVDIAPAARPEHSSATALGARAGATTATRSMQPPALFVSQSLGCRHRTTASSAGGKASPCGLERAGVAGAPLEGCRCCGGRSNRLRGASALMAGARPGGHRTPRGTACGGGRSGSQLKVCTCRHGAASALASASATPRDLGRHLRRQATRLEAAGGYGAAEGDNEAPGFMRPTAAFLAKVRVRLPLPNWAAPAAAAAAATAVTAGPSGAAATAAVLIS